jgi:RNA polymerase sigma factor (sigma-70 family)
MPSATETSLSDPPSTNRRKSSLTSAARRADRIAAETRFAAVFVHLPAVVAYARRRGCVDAQAIAAETMAIAWRRLADLPADDPRPWLFATARNLAWAEWRAQQRTRPWRTEDERGAPDAAVEIDPALAQALGSLSPADREALLLVAWEDLTPAQAAASVGISAAAFRVRLHRARRRCARALAAISTSGSPCAGLEHS